MRKETEKILTEALYDYVRTFTGSAPAQNKLDMTRFAAQHLAKVMDVVIKQEAIAIAMRMNPHIAKGFAKAEKDWNNMTKRIKKLEAQESEPERQQ